MTPACQFCAGYRDLLFTVNYRLWSPGTGQSCLRWSIVRQVLHHVRPRVSRLNYCVNAAPCSMLAWGKSLLNVKSCVSPTGPDHSRNRETVFLDHCHQTGSVSGGRRDRNVCQTSKCPKCGTHLPVGSRLSPFRNLGSLGGLDPR